MFCIASYQKCNKQSVTQKFCTFCCWAFFAITLISNMSYAHYCIHYGSYESFYAMKCICFIVINVSKHSLDSLSGLITTIKFLIRIPRHFNCHSYFSLWRNFSNFCGVTNFFWQWGFAISPLFHEKCAKVVNKDQCKPAVKLAKFLIPLIWQVVPYTLCDCYIKQT